MRNSSCVRRSHHVAVLGAIDSKASANAAYIAGAENHVKVPLDTSMARKPVEKTSTKPYGCSVKY